MPLSSSWFQKDINDALTVVRYAVIAALGVYYETRMVNVWDLAAINKFGKRFTDLCYNSLEARPLVKAIVDEVIRVRHANKLPEPSIAGFSDACALGLACTFTDEIINRCYDHYSLPDGQMNYHHHIYSSNNQRIDPATVALLDKVKAQLSEVEIGDIERCRDELFRMMESEARLVALARNSILASEATHNDDFTMVNWFGTAFTFALGVQSEVVKVLWKQWEANGMGLNQQTIGNAVDSEKDNFRIANVFRSHPAIGTMIHTTGKGIYLLARTGPQHENNAESTRKQR